MNDDNGKRRGSRPAEPQVPEEATLPVGAAELTLSTAPGEATLPVAPAGGQLQASLPAFLGGSLAGGDAIDRFAGAVPSFGNVLLAIGTGVAESQEELDRSLVETVDELQKKTITVVTDVVQELDDRGLPVPGAPTLVTEEVSLVNYVPPTQQLWERVSLSMDMTVAGMSAEHGMVLERQQTHAAASASSWGFWGWAGGSATQSSSEQAYRSSSDMQWSSGQVRMDAVLGTRRLEKLPVGAEVQIAPRIDFSQGAAVELAVTPQVTRRQVQVTVQLRKANGAVNPGQALAISSDGLGMAFAPEHGSDTDAGGRTVLLLYRDFPKNAVAAPVTGTVTVRLGQIARTLDVTL